jgi:hypothetical protein
MAFDIPERFLGRIHENIGFHCKRGNYDWFASAPFDSPCG